MKLNEFLMTMRCDNRRSWQSQAFILMMIKCGNARVGEIGRRKKTSSGANESEEREPSTAPSFLQRASLFFLCFFSASLVIFFRFLSSTLDLLACGHTFFLPLIYAKWFFIGQLMRRFINFGGVITSSLNGSAELSELLFTKQFRGFSSEQGEADRSPLEKLMRTFLLLNFRFSVFCYIFYNFHRLWHCDARVLHSSMNVNPVAFNYRKSLFYCCARTTSHDNKSRSRRY